MSDTFGFTGPLTEFWWTCEIDFLDLWDPLGWREVLAEGLSCWFYKQKVAGSSLGVVFGGFGLVFEVIVG